MGVNSKHMLGRDLKFFAVPETTYNPGLDGFTIPQGFDGLSVLASSMEYAQERVNRADARFTRSLKERITRRIEVSWSCESYVIPRGMLTAGGAATRRGASQGNDLHVLLRSALGSSAGDGGSGTTYSLTSTQSLPTLSLFREASGVGMEMILGAYTNEFTLSASGGDEPKMSFSGSASKYAFTGTTTAESGTSGPNATFTAALNNGHDNFEAGSLVQGAGGALGRVTSVDRSTGVVTTDSGSAFAAELITPYVPTPTPNSTAVPLNGISGSLALTGPTATALPITAFEVTIANNIKAINDEAFTDSITDFVTGYREITGSLSVRARADQMKEIILRKIFEPRALTVTLGSGSAGNKVIVTMPKVEFDFSALEIPEAEETTFTLPFVALQNSTSDDEMTIQFD